MAETMPDFCLLSMFLLLYIGAYLIYNVVNFFLYSKVNQLYVYMCVCVSPLLWISFSFRSPQSTE